MKKQKLTALFAVLAAGAAMAQSTTQQTPIFFSASELGAKIAHPEEGYAAALLPAGKRLTTYIVHRDSSGDAEMHKDVEHFYVVQQGEADVLLGTRTIGMHEEPKGEWYDGKIIDGKLYRVKAGDVLFVPAGVAHQWILPEQGSVTYFTVSNFVKGQN